ncbi:tRNA1(Val) (adenine(37)-N6)-methyltransferase [Capnocytophaga canimorsus]|uniref:tRNA1(Val) (adenine(37)-N6)-methyltransferase n=1 Tax=Capnocytophaga canimorsus TaxID=28188 RepID=UPI0021000CB6|nr:methyltransferase [Capnocytophaga canimorsus]
MKFTFKSFSVNQSKSAMKVGTDGVLLGAWVSVAHRPHSVLDVGSGTGLIALMLAQRTSAEQIDAVEIDSNAFEECTENFEESPWNDRLFCYHASFDDFVNEMEGETYDLIISNPPFYTQNVTTAHLQRNQARFEVSLPFENLLRGASLLLSPQTGIFAVIVPFEEETLFLEKATAYGLFPQKITHVKGNPKTKIKRSLIAFSKNQQHCLCDELVIETERHQYTPKYIELTKDFYLNL